jgi:hypothetical protein
MYIQYSLSFSTRSRCGQLCAVADFTPGIGTHYYIMQVSDQAPNWSVYIRA